MKNLSLFLAIALMAGCASHIAKTVKVPNEGIQTSYSHGMTVLSSTKENVVRVALLDRTLHLLTEHALYVSVKNTSSTPLNFTLGNLQFMVGDQAMRLMPMQEIVSRQEQRSEDALQDSKWPSLFRNDLSESTRKALNESKTVAPTEDALLDELSQEQLVNPTKAEDSKAVRAAHEAIIVSLKKHYLQPTTIAPGDTFKAFVKYQPIRRKGRPMLKVTLGKELHEFSL